MRGWNQYYEYVNATRTASKLTYWANDRFFLWLKKRHKKGARWVIAHYRHREQQGQYDRWNLGVKDGKGQMVYLYQMTDLHRHIYYAHKHPHPYLSDEPMPNRFSRIRRSRPSGKDAQHLKRRTGRNSTGRAGTRSLSLRLLWQPELPARPPYPPSAAKRHKPDGQSANPVRSCHLHTTRWGRPRGTGSTQSRRAG